MPNTLNNVLREIHRLHRLLRDLKAEIDSQPRKRKAYQGKLAKHELALKEAQDGIKAIKVANAERELQLKSSSQQVAKFEKQMDDMKSPKEVEAKQTEIATAKACIQQMEDEILSGLSELDTRVARIPALQEQVVKTKAEVADFESEAKEHMERWQSETTRAQAELKQSEVHLPPAMRSFYDRLVKAHGSDSLAPIKNRNICGNCLTAVTNQTINELLQARFQSCPSCGRGLYLEE